MLVKPIENRFGKFKFIFKYLLAILIYSGSKCQIFIHIVFGIRDTNYEINLIK